MTETFTSDPEVKRIFSYKTFDQNLFNYKPELYPHKLISNGREINNQFSAVQDVEREKYIHFSKNFEKILGFSTESIDSQFLLEHICSEDQLNVVRALERLFQYAYQEKNLVPWESGLTMDYRLRCKSGNIVRLLHTVTVIANDRYGNMLYLQNNYVNISSFKSSNHFNVEYFGLDKSKITHDLQKNGQKFSKREREIVLLMADGKVSEEIGDILSISINTVYTHRRNMLKRFGFKNSAELVHFAMEKEMI